MTWRELMIMIHEQFLYGSKNLDETVTVYDAAVGEYYPADLIEFEESDDIIDAGTMFVSINVGSD